MLKGNETLLDCLLFAFGLEKGSNLFYRKAAERVDDPRVKEFFDAMAEVERGHMAYIRLLYCGMENEACPASMEEFVESVRGPFEDGSRLIEDVLRQLDVPLLDELDAVNIALRHEDETCAFYDKAARKMSDPQVRVLFKNLAEEERKHHDELKRKLEQLKAA